MNRVKLICVMFLGISLCGCLKTRAQLKDDAAEARDSGKPVAAHVQDVHPAGQYAIDELKSEITRLTGRIEDLERSQKENTANGSASKEDAKKLETRIVELEHAQANMLEAIKKLQDSGASAAAATVDTTELFEKGRRQFQAGQMDAAVETFSQYLKHPKNKKIEEATFLRAEAYFALKEYKKAIVDYSKFPEKFSRSKYMPAALLKTGLSFDALGMSEDAKLFYQQLVEKYPKSPEAKRARPKLK